MSGADAIQLVRRAYDALETEDTEAFLGLFANDSSVRYPATEALAYGGTWQGRSGVEAFLARHDESEEILEFEPRELVAGDDTVYARGHFRGRSRITGRTWETEFVHIFTTSDGRIRRWEGFFDTAAAVEAHRA